MTVSPEPGVRIDKVVSDGEAAFAVVDAADDATPRTARAWASLAQTGPAVWALTGITVKDAFTGRGYATALIEQVRGWAADQGVTVVTRGAMPDVYGFYERVGCRQVLDDEGDVEYLVAPVG